MRPTALIIALLLASSALAETVIITFPDRSELTRTITLPADNAALVSLRSDEHAILQDLKTLETTEPERHYKGYTEDLPSLAMVSGAVFTFAQQMRIGEVAAPFAAGLWPTAELRTAKSPAGMVLVTYTTTIDDAAQAMWSHRLTAAQTAALSGKSGITEISFYNASTEAYSVHFRIPTIVRGHVTEM